jgi:hypothetical protein
MNRRKFIRSLSRTALVLPFADILALASPFQQQPQPPKPLARRSGLTMPSPRLATTGAQVSH